jgi:HAD superfamily hydrolase (TIGR01509 family)
MAVDKNLSKQILATKSKPNRRQVLENPKLKAKAVILDLDGTLVDSREAYLEASQKAFSAMGQKMVEISTAIEIPKRLEQNMSIDDLVADVNVKRFLQLYLKAYYDATASRTKPFPHVENTLKELCKKAKLALTTRRSVSKNEVLKELETFGIAGYFQEVVTSLETDEPKPSPEALIKCSKKLNVQITDCLVVGDSVVDIRAGKNAGARTVAVYSGIFSREELENEKPDLILENIKKLPQFLE